MNVRRFTTSFIAVFIVFGVLEYLIHMRILAGLCGVEHRGSTMYQNISKTSDYTSSIRR